MNGDPRDEAPERSLPANIEAEAGLLGAIFLNTRAYDRVSGFLQPEHFYDPLHQRIYAACTTLIERGEKATPATLHHLFESEHAAYLAKLAVNATTVLNAADYAKVIHDLHLRRSLIAYAEAIREGAYSAELDVTAADQVGAAREKLDMVSDELRAEVSTVSVGEAAGAAIAAAEEALQRGGGLLGLPSGVSVLDRQLHGFQAPSFIIVAGSTSMGKTSFALTVAHTAAKAGHLVGFISLEMSAKEIGERLLSFETGFSVKQIRSGLPQAELDGDPWDALLAARSRLDELPVLIEDGSGLTPDRIGAIGRRWVQQGLKLLVIDYIGLVKPPQTLARFGPVAQVTHISAALKGLAKTLNVPVVALAQLSRANRARENKRPMLSDLRDSGALEQDADVVIFLHRPDYYLERERPDPESAQFDAWRDQLDKVRGRAEVIVAKNRHGSLAVHDVRFEARTMRFAD